METKSVMIVGVGGQGTLLSSRLLGSALISKGHDVKVSEVHGMSQRGGSVVTYVKFGDKVNSPIIEKGEADYILAFEQLEAARWLPFLKIGGKMVVNTQTIDPMPVIIGNAEYPKGIIESIKEQNVSLTAIDALSMAVEAGSAKAVNIVLMGVLAAKTDIEYDVWVNAIKTTVPSKFLELNLKAFEKGYTHTRE